MRKFLVSVAAVAVLGVAGAAASFAGEVTGPVGPNGGLGHTLWTGTNGDGSHTLHGASQCAFSGLNNPQDGAEAGPGLVQSFGQIVKVAGPQGGVPGTACNPTTATP
jgi:hypothetical protein